MTRRFSYLDLSYPGDVGLMVHVVVDNEGYRSDGTQGSLYAAFVQKDHALWFCRMMNNAFIQAPAKVRGKS